MGFLEQLVTTGIINRYQMEDIIEKSKALDGDIDRALSNAGVSSDAVRSAKSAFFGLPERTLNVQNFSGDVLKYVSPDASENYKIVPIGINRGVLEIGMLNPGDVAAEGALQFISSKIKMPIDRFVISYDDYQKIAEGYHGVNTLDSDEGGNQNAFVDEILDVPVDQKDEVSTSGIAGSITEDAPATKMIGVIVKNAIDGGASDIHIENVGSEVRVRYRVDGILHTSLRPNKSFASALVAKVKTLANLKLDEKRKPQDGRFVAVVDKGTGSERKVDFRVSTLPTFYGEKVVIRILDPERGVKTLDDVGLSPEHLALVRSTLTRPHGMILMTGPTGEGKSTTLYAMLKELDREKLNIVSLEDPIEYNIPGINQSQIKPEIGYDFSDGLRSILRQDPDVIMVGEIRDKDTARLAIQAALTGHLVFATLHTNSAIGAIPRLIDMGVDPYLIAPTLLMSMAQRLVQKIVPNTGRAVPVEGAIAEQLQKEFADLPPQFLEKLPITNTVYEPQKSDQSESGLHGRLPVAEMFTVDKEIENIILTNPTENAIYEYVRKNQGMITIKEDAMLKSMAGKVPWSEVNSL
ncbi:MAG: ral secretion pathway protein [Patescibacteria group bacterium]|nr:ral secretion pathway protein [Patescibacteria group bacterium]